MNKLKTIIDLVNQGDKAKLWKYLNKSIYSKKDKIDVVKSKGGQGGGSSDSSGSNVVYLNIEPVVSAAGEQFVSLIKLVPGILAIKMVGDGITTIAPVSYTGDVYLKQTKAAAILPNFRGLVEEANDLNSDSTIEGFKELGATEITKEEFYTKVNLPI